MRNVRGNEISMIFQEPMTSLNPVYTVGKQVREAILLHQNISKEEAKNKVIDIFRKIGIPEPENAIILILISFPADFVSAS